MPKFHYIRFLLINANIYNGVPVRVEPQHPERHHGAEAGLEGGRPQGRLQRSQVQGMDPPRRLFIFL